MSPETPRHPMTMKRVLYEIPGMESVTVRRDAEFTGADGSALTMDLYDPRDAGAGARTPAVVLIMGFPDPGFEKFVGCKFKELESSVSWGRLIAASGLIAIAATNREPVGDLHALLQHVRGNAATLGIDEHRIGIWASSGHVPLALSTLMHDAREDVTCAVLCYGFTLDLDGSTGIADAERQWRFANPNAGKSIDDLRPDVPLFIARAGRDSFPHLNDALDRFLAHAVRRNLPLTFVNHAAGPHAFDLDDDSETTREIIRRILAFLRLHLVT